MKSADLSQLLNLLGAVFVLDPADARLQSLLAALPAPAGGDTGGAGPGGLLAGLAAPGDTDALHDAYLRLFIGPGPLKAPPWGSVWLDEEGVVYGASTLALQEFARAEGVTIAGPDSGPEDHFGAVLWLGAWLLAERRQDAFDTLMNTHLMPWAPAYLDAFEKAAAEIAEETPEAGFYVAAAALARVTLDEVRDGETPVAL